MKTFTNFWIILKLDLKFLPKTCRFLRLWRFCEDLILLVTCPLTPPLGSVFNQENHENILDEIGNSHQHQVSQPDCTSCYTVLMKYILPFWCDLLEEFEFKRHKKKHLFTALGDWWMGLFLRTCWECLLGPGGYKPLGNLKTQLVKPLVIPGVINLTCPFRNRPWHQ